MLLQRLNIKYVRYEGTREEELLVENSLTIDIKGAKFSEKFQKGYWDGKVKFFDKRTKTFLYGYQDRVVTYLKKKKVIINIENEVVKPFKLKGAFSSHLYNHQLEALKVFFNERCGTIQVPTRGGKTFIAAEAIRLATIGNSQFNCLFIVNTEDLYLQAKEDISGYLGVDIRSIGSIKGDVFDLQQITVATIQTIQSIYAGVKRVKKAKDLDALRSKRIERRNKKSVLLEYFTLLDFSIIDEAHEYTSLEIINIIEKIQVNCQLTMSITATAFHSESLVATMNMKRISGNVIYTIPEQVLKEEGILAKDKIMLIYIDHNLNRNITVKDTGSEEDYLAFVKQVITHNDKRNSVLVNIVEMCRKLELKMLVLFNRKNHGYYLQTITGDDFLCGDHTAEIRTSVKKKFLGKKGGVLFASDIYKKGVTLPEVEVYANAGGGKEKNNVTQKKGRVLGTTKTKQKALIIDFIDNFDYFKDHSLNRIAEYERSVLNKNDIVVFDINDNEFYNDVRNFIEEWFDK